MSFAVKDWYNKVGSGTPLDAPSLATQTPLDAAALRDLETRLSAYSETMTGVSSLNIVTADTFEDFRLIGFGNGTVRAIPRGADPPGTPTGLAALSKVASVRLTWSAPAGAVSYILFRDSVEIAYPTSTGYRDLGVATGVHYGYQVQAIDAYGQRSPVSAVVNAFTDPALNVAPVTTVKAWPASTPASGRQLVRICGSDPDGQAFTPAMLADTGTLTATDDPTVWIYEP